MSKIIRQRLARAPMLLTAYFVWVNRGQAYRRKTLSAGIALFACWIAAVLIFLRTDRAAAIAALGWIQRHDLSAATICGIAAAVLVSRRRALNRMSEPRSWTAALPVERSTRIDLGDCSSVSLAQAIAARSGFVGAKHLGPGARIHAGRGVHESWLCWVLGAPVARCIAIGTLTLVTGTVFAVTGSIFAIYADKNHAIDGPDDGV